MKEMPKVSVIVPVYNKQDVIACFIETLRRQTLQCIEFIFIDDKSTDNSVEIIQNIMIQDPRVVLIVNETNMGPGSARNRGIEIAKGRFIAFLDPDDAITDDFFELLYKKALERKALVVKGKRVKKIQNGKEEESPLNALIKQGIGKASTLLNLFSYEHTTAIYSRELVNKVGARNAPDSRQDEDTCFLAMLMSHVTPRDFSLEERAVYYYVQNDDSLTHSEKDSIYLHYMLRSTVFKADYFFQNPSNLDASEYLSVLLESRLSVTVRSALSSRKIVKQDVVDFVMELARIVQRWKISEVAYRPRFFTSFLERLRYDPKDYLAYFKLYEIVSSDISRKLSEPNFSGSDIGQNELKYFRFALVEPYVRLQYYIAKCKYYLSYGCRREKYLKKSNYYWGILQCQEIYRREIMGRIQAEKKDL